MFFPISDFLFSLQEPPSVNVQEIYVETTLHIRTFKTVYYKCTHRLLTWFVDPDAKKLIINNGEERRQFLKFNCFIVNVKNTCIYANLKV